MSKKLFVFEGAKTEINITKNLAINFSETFSEIFTEDDVKCAYCTTIYDLFKKISEDEFLDMFMILKEINFNKNILENYKSSDFAEIYLFFDYDGHAPIANDNEFEKILEMFDEETNFGKIFISYPMVESLKHISGKIEFKTLTVEAKKNINYKHVVHESCDVKYKDFNQYDKHIWKKLIDLHIRKMHFIVNGNYTIPTETFTQEIIFKKQRTKYIQKESKVAVLSAFPIFLLDYYGSETIIEIIK